MLIIALVLAVIGLAALVTAVVTSNELIAWVCIGASVIGVLLLVVDAVRERSAGRASDDEEDASTATAEDYPDESEHISADDDDTAAAVSQQSDGGEVSETNPTEAAEPEAAKPD